MPLPTFEKQDDIPEAVRGGYVEKNGKWVPEVDDSGLRENHRRAVEESRSLKEQIKNHLGDRKLEEVGEIIKSHETAEEKRQRDAGKHDEILAKRLKEKDDQAALIVKENAELKRFREDTILDGAIRTAAAKGGVIADDMHLVIPIVKGSRIRLDDKGKPVVYDADGDVTGLTVEKFFAETFKAEASKFYQPAGGSGGGASSGSSSAAQRSSASGSIQDPSFLLANLEGIGSGKVKAR
jgi:hypothetical protein